MQVYVARHGETTWNVAGRYQGRRDAPLSDLGGRQGAALAGAMAALEPPIGRIIASPLGRCTATAAFVAERLGLAVETDELLLEIGHGTWEGRLRSEIAADEPERLKAWRELPGSVAFENGETLVQVANRWAAFATALQPARPLLVVTHDVVVRLALLYALELGFDRFWSVPVENAGYAAFDVDRGRWSVVSPNVNGHLDGVRAPLENQAL